MDKEEKCDRCGYYEELVPTKECGIYADLCRDCWKAACMGIYDNDIDFIRFLKSIKNNA